VADRAHVVLVDRVDWPCRPADRADVCVYPNPRKSIRFTRLTHTVRGAQCDSLRRDVVGWFLVGWSRS